MEYLTVDLYEDFHCIADACPNSCCIGWDIFIDEKTYGEMKKHEEQLGVLAKDWLIQKDNITSVILNGVRCPMLTENNLCKVVLRLGDSYLSHTCAQYPRLIDQYGGVMERYMATSCPEVITKLMNAKAITFNRSGGG